MLRDVICNLPGAATWPCDEINPVWRHGNLEVPHDAFPAQFARPRVIHFVRNRFARFAKRSQAQWLVEKTCANMLRVGFIHATLPEARFLRIRRDGRDVVPSAMLRWQAPLNLKYTLRKARFVPWTDFPYYLWRFAANRLSRLGKDKNERSVSTWGPRFPGMDKIVNEVSLAELCARQWQSCELAATEQLALIPSGQVLSLRYEDFIAAPLAAMVQIRTFLNAPWSDEVLADAVAKVKPGRPAGKRNKLDAAQLSALEPFLTTSEPSS